MIAIIIPTFNERSNIFRLIKKLLKIDDNFNIYIIDDTKEYHLKEEFKKLNNVYYLHRKNQRGRGSAVINGLNIALKNKKNDIFIEMDADFSHRPIELKKKIKKFKKKKLDLLIASRYLKKSKIYNWSTGRRLFSRLSNFLARILLDLNVTDYTNGYRIYSKQATKVIVKYCGNIGDGFIVLSEILLQIKMRKLKIAEDNTIFKNRKRGESSVNLSLILSSLFGIFKLFFLKKKLTTI
jgi:dolichol-phosphate mannosyltransferase